MLRIFIFQDVFELDVRTSAATSTHRGCKLNMRDKQMPVGSSAPEGQKGGTPPPLGFVGQMWPYSSGVDTQRMPEERKRIDGHRNSPQNVKILTFPPQETTKLEPQSQV